MDGTDPLTPIGNCLFRIGKEADPGVVEFSELIGGRPSLLWMDGGSILKFEGAAS